MSSGPERDWDKELAEIDRLMSKTPSAKPGAPAPGAGVPAAQPARPVVVRPARRQALFVWLRVGLGVALAAGMTQWPYARACGVPLLLYGGAVAVVATAGLWSAVHAWRQRMPAAHAAALLVVGWAAVLAALILLPRIGYARDAATWWCP